MKDFIWPEPVQNSTENQEQHNLQGLEIDPVELGSKLPIFSYKQECWFDEEAMVLFFKGQQKCRISNVPYSTGNVYRRRTLEEIAQNWNHLKQVHIKRLQYEKIEINWLVERLQPKLQVLNLNRINANDSTAQIISKSNWPALQSLSLRHTNITDKGMRYISKSNFQKLKIVYFDDNKVTANFLSYLVNHNMSPTLIQYSTISDQLVNCFESSIESLIVVTGRWDELIDLNFKVKQNDTLAKYAIINDVEKCIKQSTKAKVNMSVRLN